MLTSHRCAHVSSRRCATPSSYSRRSSCSRSAERSPAPPGGAPETQWWRAPPAGAGCRDCRTRARRPTDVLARAMLQTRRVRLPGSLEVPTNAASPATWPRSQSARRGLRRSAAAPHDPGRLRRPHGHGAGGHGAGGHGRPAVHGIRTSSPGSGFAFGDTPWMTALQRNVPEHALSRISSFDWLGSVALNPIGYALIGPLAVAIGTSEDACRRRRPRHPRLCPVGSGDPHVRTPARTAADPVV